MKHEKIKIYVRRIVTANIILWASYLSAQSRGYHVDSLQIKVYTEIEYKNSKPKEIKLKRIFCDYCSENQKKAVGEQALRRTFAVRYEDIHKLKNGTKKLALYIRISKKDFLKLKDE